MASSVNERLKEVRKMLKLNQEQFAKEIGVSRAHISNMENGNDNPSSALIKLICMKFNIEEEWLANGVGSPYIVWDMRTDEGAVAKYNAMRVKFENKLRKRSGEDLINTIEAFAYLDALFSYTKLNDEEASMYIKYVCSIIDDFEKLIFQSSKSILPSKKDAQGWMNYKNRCNEYVSKITENVKNAANLYLDKHGDQMKL